jgi:hypothetical protein
VVTAGSRELTVSWQAVEGAESYEVWAGISNNSASAVKQGADTTELSAAITNLINGTTYYVWIKAKNTAGTSGFSQAASAVPFTRPGLYKGATFNEAVEIGSQNLDAALAYIYANAQTGDNFFIVLGMDANISPKTLGYSNKTVGITLMTDGAERTVQLTSNGSLFTVDTGVTLTLENNVTLKGRSSNTASLVRIESAGIFTMNGGKISSNIVSYSGGGVSVNGGTFTMSGGEISGNTASSNGGGVYVSGGTFTMSDGEISGNTTSSSSSSYYGGGGVYVGGGTFTMSGGEISGNSASSSGAGGGVYVSSGMFTKSDTGGVIYGNNTTPATLQNSASGNGDAVYRNSGSKKRNSTIPATEAFNGSANVGWE